MATKLNVAYIKTKGSNTFDVLRVGATGNLEYASIGVLNLTTSNVAEGSNLYYTNTRVYANISPLLDLKANVVDLTTSNVVEGNNLYYSNTRANAAIDNRVTKAFIDNLGISSSSAAFAQDSNVANTVLSISNFTTANLIEGANLYYTNARVYANVIGLLNAKANVVDLTTSNVTEGNNLYYTNARVYANVIGLLNVKANVSDLTTANVAESTTALYYTNARVRSTLSSGTGVSYDKTSGEISIGQNVDTHANVTFSELTITGNLNVIGNVVGVYANTLIVQDPLIQLGYNNPSDSIDLGFIGHYNEGGTERHAGLFRDASDKKFKFFANITGDPSSTTVDTDNISFRLATVVAETFQGNIIGDVTGFVSSIGNFTTSDLTEGNRLYYTNARVDAYVTPKLTTANVAELTNLYYTNARVYSNVISLLNAKANVVDLTTANITESAGNLYYTNARVYSNVTALLPTYTGNLTAGNATIGGTSGGFITGANLISTNIISATTWTGLYAANVAGLTTANVAELTNLYYTNARVYSNVIGIIGAKANVSDLTTANVAELTNLYYTNARVYANVIEAVSNKANVSDLTTSNVIEGTNLYYTNARVYANISPLLFNYQTLANAALKANIVDLTTSNVVEGTNLYYTNARVYSNVIALIGNKANISDLTTANVLEVGDTIYYTNARVYANVIGLLNAKANVVDLTTSNVVEGDNLYYTNARVYANVIGIIGNKANISDLTTANVLEVGSNIYYTNARVYANVIGLLNAKSNVVDLTTANVAELNNLYYTNARVYANVIGLIDVKANVVDLTTANVAELNNLYYTNARVYSNVLAILQNYTGNITAGNIIANTVITSNLVINGFELFSNNDISVNRITANSWQNLYTANVLETSGNLYYTNARVYANVLEYLAANPLTVNVAASLVNFGSNIINTTGNITAGNVIANSFVQLGSGQGAITSTSNLNISATGNINLLTGNVVISNRLIVGGATSNIIIDGDAGNIIITNSLTTNNLIIKGFELFSNNDITINRVTANIWTNLYTGNVIENPASGNLWYSNARVLSNILAYIAVNPQGTTYTNSNVTHFMNIFGSNSIVTTGNITAGNIIVTTNLTVRGTLTANAISANSGGGFITGANLISTNILAVSRIQGIVGTNGLVGNINLTANVMPQGNGIINLGNATNYFGNVFVKTLISTELRTSGKTLYIGETAISVDDDNNLVITNPSGGVITLKGNFSSNTDLTTANVTELTNLYYTNDRVRSNVTELLPVYTGNISSGNITIGYGTGGSLIGANLITTNIISATTWTGLYTSNVIENTNLYYTNARVLAGLVTSNLVVNDATILGNLYVEGDIVTLNTATLIVEDKNIVLANGAINSGTADGAGFSIDGAQANLTYRSTGDKFEFNKSLDVIGTVTAAIVYANVWNNLYTSNVLENAGNLYYTVARANTAIDNRVTKAFVEGLGISVSTETSNVANTVVTISNFTTANLAEGTNLYYTNTRVYSNVIGLLTNLATTANLDLKANIVDLTTSNVVELNNLYYTNARVRTAIAAGNGISYSNVTGVISLSNLVVSDTVPSYPYNGQVWVDTNSGIRFEYIDDGTSAQWVEFGAGGGGGSSLSSRTTVTGTTASIAANITANIQITGFKGYALYKIGVTNNAWVRVYTTQAARLADSTRSSGIDPSGNAGVIAEIITTGNQTISLSPAVMGYNDEATPNTTIAVAVTNLTTGTTSFTVSLTLIQLES